MLLQASGWCLAALMRGTHQQRMTDECMAVWRIHAECHHMLDAHVLVCDGECISGGACRRYAGKRLAELLRLQAAAKRRRRGIWQGKFDEPERWRQRLG